MFLKNLSLLVHVSIGETPTDEMTALIHCLINPAWIRTLDQLPWNVESVLVVNGVIQAFIHPKHMNVVHQLPESQPPHRDELEGSEGK